ncbi:MAG: DUF6390 family protein [Candidatus Diapherotrites archaeon]
MAKMSGLELFARFALMPNKLNLCGPKDFHQKFYDFIAGRHKDESEIRYGIRQFEVAFPYLKLIAQKNYVEDLIDFSVVEAYFIGNSLLNKCNGSDIRKLIQENFAGWYKLSPEIAQKIALGVPNSAVPHHSFHVLNIAAMTELSKATVDFMDKDRVCWGTLKEFSDESALIEFRPIVSLNKKLFLGPLIEKEIEFHKEFFPKTKIGATIAFHWDFAVLELSRDQQKSLSFYTQQALDFANKERK